MAQHRSPVRRAVIDVGTNSVKLLVAEVSGATVNPLLEQSEQTRLGRGFYETHRLQPEPLALTAQAIARFQAGAEKLRAAAIRVIATSAARDAQNAEELVHAIRAATGLPLEIISGEQEADWTFQGVTSAPELAQAPLLVLDIGGGSTEFIYGAEGRQQFRQSFPLGSVRLLEQLRPGDPPAAGELAACREHLRQFFAEKILPQLPPALKEPGSAPPAERLLVGTGGTASILARIKLQTNRFDRRQIEHTPFTLDEVRRELERLWRLPLAERKQIVGLPPNRADVILFGAAIIEAVMRELRFKVFQISTRGLRFAALMDENQARPPG